LVAAVKAGTETDLSIRIATSAIYDLISNVKSILYEEMPRLLPAKNTDFGKKSTFERFLRKACLRILRYLDDFDVNEREMSNWDDNEKKESHLLAKGIVNRIDLCRFPVWPSRAPGLGLPTTTM